jgi:hypothetical protein
MLMSYPLSSHVIFLSVKGYVSSLPVQWYVVRSEIFITFLLYLVQVD